MNTELLYQLFLIVLIIIGAFLIVVLWKVLDILKDVKTTSTIVSKRSIQADHYIGSIVNMGRDLRDTAKGFLYSFDLIKLIKQKFIK